MDLVQLRKAILKYKSYTNHSEKRRQVTMKKLLLLLVLLLVFSACSQQPVEPIPAPQPTDETVLDFSMEELQAELNEF